MPWGPTHTRCCCTGRDTPSDSCTRSCTRLLFDTCRWDSEPRLLDTPRWSGGSRNIGRVPDHYNTQRRTESGQNPVEEAAHRVLHLHRSPDKSRGPSRIVHSDTCKEGMGNSSAQDRAREKRDSCYPSNAHVLGDNSWCRGFRRHPLHPDSTHRHRTRRACSRHKSDQQDTPSGSSHSSYRDSGKASHWDRTPSSRSPSHSSCRRDLRRESVAKRDT